MARITTIADAGRSSLLGAKTVTFSSSTASAMRCWRWRHVEWRRDSSSSTTPRAFFRTGSSPPVSLTVSPTAAQDRIACSNIEVPLSRARQNGRSEVMENPDTWNRVHHAIADAIKEHAENLIYPSSCLSCRSHFVPGPSVVDTIYRKLQEMNLLKEEHEREMARPQLGRLGVMKPRTRG